MDGLTQVDDGLEMKGNQTVRLCDFPPAHPVASMPVRENGIFCKRNTVKEAGRVLGGEGLSKV